MKEKLKKVVLFITNPKLLLCVGIGWMITNGWSYVLFGLGTYYDIKWMIGVSGAYLAFLWFPFTPEKLLTLAIAIFLLKWLFPKDEKTLGTLKNMHSAYLRKKAEKKQAKGNNAPAE